MGVYAPARLAHLKRDFPRSLDGQSFTLPMAHGKSRHDLEHYSKLNRLRIIPLVETQDTSLQKLLGTGGQTLLTHFYGKIIGAYFSRFGFEIT